MPVRFYFIGTIFILTILTAPAQAQQMEPAQTSKQRDEAGPKTPSLEFLEFLGEWETEDGRWIDPEELDKIPLPVSEKNNEEEDETN